MSWALCNLESLAADSQYSFVGGPFGSKLTTRDYVDEGVPVIRGSNLGNGRFLDTRDFVYVTEAKVREDLFGNLAKPGDLIFTQRGTLGQVALVPEDGPSDRYVVSQSQMKMTVDEEKADRMFLYYYFTSREAVQRIVSYVSSSGVPHINLSVLRDFEVPTPPLQVQHAIASILSAYDDLIENNRRRIQLLEQAARLLYKEWFVHLRFPGHEHVKIKDGVPEGWERRHLSELVDTQYGFTETASSLPIGPKFLRGMDINKNSYIDWSTVPYCQEDRLEFDKYALRPGDLVVIRMADPGKVAIVEKDIKAVFASYLVRLKLKREVGIPPLYLFYILSDDAYQGFISSASGGSTRKSASAKLLVDFKLSVPPILLLSLFINIVQPLRRQIALLLDQNAALGSARDLFLPRLMNGEIAV
jgi:type I restriction enzyme S subunit